ncbi:MAG: response regulator [Blastocatellia bacterium]|nr:response regulator [Blastocatellia bacterium]
MLNSRIMIVEDENITAMDIEEMLIGLGFDTTLASSGQEAVRKAKDSTPDLVLMDIVLPGAIDGIEAAEQIHANLGIPVVYMTAYSDTSTLQRARKTEPLGYLLKPLKERELLATIDMALYKHSMERRLKESEERYRRIIETAEEGVWITGADNETTFVNRKMAEMLGYSVEEVLGRPIFEFMDEEWRKVAEMNLEERRKGVGGRFDFKYRRKDGTDLWTIRSTTPMFDDRGKYIGVLAMITDITERKHLEQQFLQSQKMESIGRLAGGIAHDFNNLLTAIMGYSQMILARLKESDPMREEVQEIERASRRAASLTSQLLAFSRKQILQPKVLDLNIVVANMEKMLLRLISEDIELVTKLDASLGRVKVDPGQIEQVMVNLAVNARDAMPKGGKLIVETTNVELDEGYARKHMAVRPGPYVMLAISDTGSGMDEETQSRIFEPFFTTKEQGKGTGLGLSTVYGIVEQSGGNIWLYSEPGRGTTFKVYLPCIDEPAGTLDAHASAVESFRGSETILLVEDDEAVRKLTRQILEMNGYTVLEAGNAGEALAVCQQHTEPIDLMITDVVMPGMSGHELAERLALTGRELKVLYMSGYTDNAIVRHGIMDEDTTFLQKPFTPDSLARKAREVLEKP